MKNWATFHHFFHLSFRKVLYESVLFFIIKVPYEYVLLSIITCRHLSLTYHTQKYFIKAFYYLAKTWLSLITYHSQKRILSVFYFVEFPLGMWVNKRIKPTQKQKAFCKTCCKLKKHSVYIKFGASLTTLKIGELLLTANSPNLSDLTIWRVTVNG